MGIQVERSEKFPEATFMIQLHSEDHATWQGTLTWIEKDRSLLFCSTLEMLQLMDNATEEYWDQAEASKA